MSLVKIKARTDYVDEVYKVLLDAISEGSLAPGSRLTQEEIAAQLEVSRSPVLQALRLLKKDGLVLDAPGRGLLVAPLDASCSSKGARKRAARSGSVAICVPAAPQQPKPASSSSCRRVSRGATASAIFTPVA